MYYGLVVLSVLMFGVQFLCSDRYQKENGTKAFSVFVSNGISALMGVICLLVINGFDLSVTRFTLMLSLVSALNSILCGICTLKALERVNLSVYSLFSMLGGMMLPFLAGLMFYGEAMTWGKGVCVVLIVASLLLTVERARSRGGVVYYVGVFFFNGLSGVLSKMYEDAPYDKVSSAGYSLWIALWSLLLCVVALLCLWKTAKMPSAKAIFWSAGGGLLNRVANWILLVALTVLPATIQYPFVTGGVVVVSTLLAALTGQKPSKREILAVGLSFAGLLSLLWIP